MNGPTSKVLVTGGCGFIGSHVVAKLLALGHLVSVLDNISSGVRENLPPHPNLTVHVGDLRSDADIDEAIDSCEAVVHLAAEASVQKSLAYPLATHEVNYVGTMRLTNIAEKRGIESIVFASSAAVYGAADSFPIRESDALRPVSPYAIDKLASEYLLQALSLRSGMTTTALRFFNVYGEGQDVHSEYSGVVSIFLERLTNRLPVHIYGDGHQSRDFVYVGDAVRAVIAALGRQDGSFLVCNVGTGKQTTILHLLELLTQIVGFSHPTVFEPKKSADISDSYADVVRLAEVLKSPAETPLDQGLRSLHQNRLRSTSERR